NRGHFNLPKSDAGDVALNVLRLRIEISLVTQSHSTAVCAEDVLKASRSVRKLGPSMRLAGSGRVRRPAPESRRAVCGRCAGRTRWPNLGVDRLAHRWHDTP